MEIKGVIPAILTPLDTEEKVNETILRQLLEHVIAGGVHGVFVLGSTGEFYGLDWAEKRRAVEITIDQVKGRVPVLVGASAITTRECLEITKMAKETGADAVSVLTPYLITPTDRELEAHYCTIAESVDIPITIYNNPERTHVNISAALIERLADVPNIVGVKNSSGDLTLTMEYIQRTQGKNFGVMAGKDSLIFATLAHGGIGTVASTANVVPRLVVEIYEQFVAGNWSASLQAQYRLLPLRLCFALGSWPVLAREALQLMGFEVGDPIKPIQHMTEPNLAKLKAVLQDLGAIK